MSFWLFSRVPRIFTRSLSVGFLVIVIQRPLSPYVDWSTWVPLMHLGEHTILLIVVPPASLSQTRIPVDPVGFHSKSTGLLAMESTLSSCSFETLHVEPFQYAVWRSAVLSSKTAWRSSVTGSAFRVVHSRSAVLVDSRSKVPTALHAEPFQYL